MLYLRQMMPKLDRLRQLILFCRTWGEPRLAIWLLRKIQPLEATVRALRGVPIIVAAHLGVRSLEANFAPEFHCGLRRVPRERPDQFVTATKGTYVAI